MTGAYVRVKRNGKFENIEIEHLTDAEREELFLTSGMNTIQDVMKWLHMTCHKLTETEELFNGLVEDGILEKTNGG